MKTVILRESDTQLSTLVREIEETGESVLVLRNGKPVVKLIPAERDYPRKLTPEQEAALARLRDPKNHFTSNDGDWKISRAELHDEIESRHAIVRELDARMRKKQS